jgi:hypothetical protein
MIRISFHKTMDDFDFSIHPSIGRSVIDELMTARYIHKPQIFFLECGEVLGDPQ